MEKPQSRRAGRVLRYFPLRTHRKRRDACATRGCRHMETTSAPPGCCVGHRLLSHADLASPPARWANVVVGGTAPPKEGVVIALLSGPLAATARYDRTPFRCWKSLPALGAVTVAGSDSCSAVWAVVRHCHNPPLWGAWRSPFKSAL